MRILLVSIWVLALCAGARAQDTQYQTFSSPDVASLAAQVKTPVSFSAGAMSVDIPLYTLKDGDIEVPVSLSYDATGIRVGAVPGLTGQNWTLKAGGLITRVVKGTPDEAMIHNTVYFTQSGQVANFTHLVGYGWNRDELAASDWYSEAKIKEVASREQETDLEPDEFIFNFCGHSGSFYMDHTGKGVVIGKQGYRIQMAVEHNIPIYDGRLHIIESNGRENAEAFTYRDFYTTTYHQLHQSKIIGIKIIDPYGYEYYFGQYEKWIAGTINHYEDNFDGIEITSTFFGQLYDEIYNTWYLMKIVSPTKREVTFTYRNGYPTAIFSTSYTYSDTKVVDNGSSGLLSWFWKGGYTRTSRGEFGIDGRLIRPQVLTSVETQNYKIDFTNTDSRALDYDYAGQIQSYQYYIERNLYSPDIISEWWHGACPVTGDLYIIPGYEISFDNPANPGQLPIYGRILNTSLLKREKLSEMSIRWKHGDFKPPIQYLFSYRENPTERLQLTSIQKQAGGQTLPPYRFTYNNAKKLPVYLDPRTDHWGYYNANSNLTNVVPSSQYASYLSYKNANASCMDSEILQKIEYPTGGTKEFVYQPNSYNKVVRRNTSDGSLSVATVPETVGGGLRIREIIERPAPGAKSEHRIYTYTGGILNGEHQYYWPNYVGRLTDGDTYTATRFFTHSILPVSSNPAGGSVSYSKVTETIPGSGRTERTYTNHDDYLDENALACIDPRKSPYSPLSSRAALRGNLLSEEVFREGATTPVSRTSYAYTSLDSHKYIRAMQAKGYRFDSQTPGLLEGSSYKIYTGPVSVASVSEMIWPDNSTTPFQTVTNYTYNDYFDVASEEVVGSNEGAETRYKTVYSYVYDTPATEINTASGYGRDVSRNTLVNRNMLKLPVIVSKYKNNVLDHRLKYHYAYSSYQADRIFERSVSKLYGASEHVTTRLLNLDRGGNPESVLNDQIPSVLIWGYNYQSLIAEIKNATMGAVNTALSELGTNIHAISSAPIPDMALFNSLRTKLRGAEITTYTYEPLVGIQSVIDPSGFARYYTYDVFGRLTEVYDIDHLLQSYEYHYDR